MTEYDLLLLAEHLDNRMITLLARDPNNDGAIRRAAECAIVAKAINDLAQRRLAALAREKRPAA